MKPKLTWPLNNLSRHDKITEKFHNSSNYLSFIECFLKACCFLTPQLERKNNGQHANNGHNSGFLFFFSFHSWRENVKILLLFLKPHAFSPRINQGMNFVLWEKKIKTNYELQRRIMLGTLLWRRARTSLLIQLKWFIV